MSTNRVPMVPLVATIMFTYFYYSDDKSQRVGVMIMVFNVTFNNISGISWRSVLSVKETEGPGENHRPVASH